MSALVTNNHQLLQELHRLRSKRDLDPLTLARLQREAQNLLTVDALNTHLLLGTLASLTGDLDNIHTNHQQALALLHSDNARVWHNYATALEEIGYFAAAVEPAIKAYTYDHKCLSVTKILAKAGLFHRAAELIRQDQLADDFLIVRTAQFMDQHGVSDTELQQLIEIALAVLHAHQFFDFDADRVIIPGFAEDENSQWFRYVIKINRSVEEIVDMEYELACQLAEDDLPTKLLLNFIPVYEIAEEQYGTD